MGGKNWAEGPWFVRSMTTSGMAVVEDGKVHGLTPIICEWDEAYLIAAAPELYEALTGLLNECDANQMEELRADENWGPLMRAADYALAKARGEQ